MLHVVCRAEKGSVISWVAVATDTSTFAFHSCVGCCQQAILQLNVNVDEKIYVWKLSQKKQNHLPSVISWTAITLTKYKIIQKGTISAAQEKKEFCVRVCVERG